MITRMNVSLPKIQIDGETLSELDAAIQREWIITNGIGGYASSTVLGINTRKYHGLLVAAFNPPTDRRVLLTRLDEEIEIGNKIYPLGSSEFRDKIEPKGYRCASSFILNPFPTLNYSVEQVHLQKTIFMPRGKNATIVIYQVSNPKEDDIVIRISPFVNSRHFHSVTDKDEVEWRFVQKPSKHKVTIQPSIQLSTLTLFSSDGHYIPNEGGWREDVFLRVDGSRAESSLDDNFNPGHFELEVASEEGKRTFLLTGGGRDEMEVQNILSTFPRRFEEIDALYNRELNRQRDLLKRFRESHRDIAINEWLKWLLLSADSFIVNRRSTGKKSVIAGYHWFEDWGRDSLISLPGLTLVTGRFKEAEQILLTFKLYCREGLIPNRFPDRTGDEPEYNTVDATLWYINAVLQYLKYTGGFDFVRRELWDTLKSIIEHHVQGTLYHIHMEEDGLIAHGPQLTWMDAIADHRYVTPREGEAVEIQALWYNALKTMELLAAHFGLEGNMKRYSGLAKRVRESFIDKFWNPQKDCLFDVINREEKDSSLRPNQVIAAALDFTMLESPKGQRVVESVQNRLWSTYGLRTLSQGDPRYVGKYVGDWNQRNDAYHNGTVWPWLIGPFTTAFLR
ncbi:glycogen debranching protein, partial [Candidatus Bathyarchaeota archaeon]|nr:glycogen debranching protein [Candidatus Bathyarchaeota archaeon]NIU81540.1 glycogen debranching protein [Candidatus Bathyarchaeota archaeon]NIV67654.1 glycogen debranching protein [Candidatus Bathyarchaeota archaeon]NIW16562.1 glycogen debranching protein [Candidatus Bathyarchaeota archaeon]NIW34702.1 glycogen debranching protein [Candidatus Bathyarchaeota archaeon]